MPAKNVVQPSQPSRTDTKHHTKLRPHKQDDPTGCAEIFPHPQTLRSSPSLCLYCSVPGLAFSQLAAEWMDAEGGREVWRSKWDPDEMPRCVSVEVRGMRKAAWREGEWLDWLCVRWDSGHLVILVFAKSAREACRGEDGEGEKGGSGGMGKAYERANKEKHEDRGEKEEESKEEVWHKAVKYRKTLLVHDEKMK